MIYKFSTADPFKKEFKALFKKYKTLDKDLLSLMDEIKANPNLGTPLGNGIKKIRLNISSKKQGKSGGARVITHEIEVLIDKKEGKSILFVSIYDKSDFDTVELATIKDIIKDFRDNEEVEKPKTSPKILPSSKKKTPKSLLKRKNKTLYIPIIYKKLSLFSESFFAFCLHIQKIAVSLPRSKIRWTCIQQTNISIIYP